MIKFSNDRKHERLNLNFQASLNRKGLDSSIEGVTRNVSQEGGLIATKERHPLKLQDMVLVTIFIPPTFSGQDVTIGLQGKAVVARLDLANCEVALQFAKGLKQFERVE